MGGANDERLSRKEYAEELEKKEKAAREEREGKKPKKPVPSLEDNPFTEDADDDLGAGSDKESEDKEGDDDDDDDEDTEELMRELAKIKREREAEEEKQREIKKKQDDREKREEIMMGNPLMEHDDLSLKRKWDDDTVFKNQARLAPKQKQRFINDAVRSDFHKRFLNKYMWIDGHAH